jgi:hypothetical protein
MDREALVHPVDADPPLLPPFPILVAGLGLIGAAWLMARGFPGPAVIRVLFLVVGLVAVGAALALHLPRTGTSSEGRLLSGGLWVLAAVAGLIARDALDPDWDRPPVGLPQGSFSLLLMIAALVAMVAAAITVLPPRGRMLAVSALILFHFVGILVAVVNVPPPGGAPPWLAHQLWMRVYRPYLTITNLNNGYHFYAPEPGPCALLYFRVEFADGYAKWVRIPDHPNCTSHVERRRLGALATSVGQSMPVPQQRLDRLIQRRHGDLVLPDDPPMAVSPRDIPPGNMPMQAQYREPGVTGKMLLSSYAGHVARTTEHPLSPTPVTGVKVYLVEFHNPLVQDFAEGQDPLDPILYLPYYMGEYDANGKLKPSSVRFRRNAEGQIVEGIQDPLLYWLIPIFRLPPNPEGKDALPPPGSPYPSGKPAPAVTQGKLKNFVYIHAGDKDRSEEALP